MKILSNYQTFLNRDINRCFSNKQASNAPISINGEISCEKRATDIYNYQFNNVVFKSIQQKMQLKNAAEEIFNRAIVFGKEEYKNLSNADIAILREYQKFFLEDRSINYVFSFITKFGKVFSERMHEKFPNGFTFVSVGRSPAFLAKYMEFQGEDVKYCPISNMRFGFEQESFTPHFVETYKKYLDSIGLTKEMVKNAQKPIIIADYNYEGHSLKNFKSLMSLPEIGIKEGEKLKFCPITLCPKFERDNCIFNYDPYGRIAGKTEKWNFSDSFYVDNMEYNKTKWYTGIPYLDVRNFGEGEENILNIYYQNGNKFEENFYVKMMNFLVLEHIKSV